MSNDDNKSILVVDDSPELLDMFSIVFKRNNLSSRVANGLDSMFKQLQAKLPDLILLDVMLSGSDGRELCKELKSRKGLKNTPIILMSASAGKLKNYKDFGADDILEKPFDLKMVVSKVKKLLPKE